MWNLKRKEHTEEDIKKLRNRIFARTLQFTETIVTWVTYLYIINWFVSVGLIIWAIKETQTFSYLDTLITETNETFRQVAIAAVIKYGIENVFKYNDFGGKVPTRKADKHNDEFENPQSEDIINDDEGGIKG